MTKERVFRINFYPHEWLSQTSHMTAEERGIFITIIAMIYARRGPIVNDHKFLARACHCSSRLITAVVNRLLTSDDIQLVQDPVDNLWKITQRRCERELLGKQKQLELSANGGRTKAENERESKQFNLLSSTSIPSHLSSPEPSSFSVTTREEVLKCGKEGFHIRNVVSALGIEAAKRLCPGWDVYALMPKYDAAVRKMGVPDMPDRAFPAWCARYTKGKPPA